MKRRPTVRLVLAPLLVIAVAVTAGWLVDERSAADPRPPLASALDVLPSATVVAGFTDWSAIRRDLGLGDASTAAARSRLGDDAALRDLSTRSVLAESVEPMHASYGWSVADLEWESYGQAAGGAAMVARTSSRISFADVEKRLRALGYTRDGAVWTLGDEGRVRVGPALASALGTVALLPGRRLVVATSSAAYAPVVLATIRGDEPSLLARRPVADIAGQLSGSASALVQAQREACRSTAVGEGDPDVAAQADAAVARTGGLAAPRYAGRGLVDGPRRQHIRFAWAYASPRVAADQLETRTSLATGPFIGRSGRVEDSLDLVSATVRGSAAALRFDLDPDRGAYMSGEGPLLFAACPASR
ncbi:hypothetical protein GEV29_01445 [Aeromicrobium sp. SMF47]|uniref:hypothetical protein n=1 Tax=Aeromicrobium yanjiei TaxID=2662028 RepID=UPI00129E1938|nr:hypothetical protein [Aeromicrobium yanjiei]MRJ75193.1 hypothetical protein [Aeromicrobium yanjiei]